MSVNRASNRYLVSVPSPSFMRLPFVLCHERHRDLDMRRCEALVRYVHEVLAEHEPLERKPDERGTEHLAQRLDIVELDVMGGRVAAEYLDRKRVAGTDDRLSECVPEGRQPMA